MKKHKVVFAGDRESNKINDFLNDGWRVISTTVPAVAINPRGSVECITSDICFVLEKDIEE